MRACKICECGEILYYSPPKEECPDPCPICGRMTLGYEAFAENDPRIELERNKILEKRSVTRVRAEEEELEEERSDDPYGTNETVVLQPSGVQTPPSFSSPSGVQAPPSFSSPSGVQTPPSFSSPSGVQAPPSFSSPSGVQAPPSFSSPSGVQAPPSFSSPSGPQTPPGFGTPSGVQTPPGFGTPSGMQTPPGFGTPSGVQTSPGFSTPPAFQNVSGATISENSDPAKEDVSSNKSVPSWKQAAAGGVKEPAQGAKEKKLIYRLRSIQRGYVIELPDEDCIVGRTAVGGEQLAHNNAVSREHIKVQINKRQRGIYVTDISQFGTKIDGNPLIKNNKRPLLAGHRITLYNEELILEVIEET